MPTAKKFRTVYSQVSATPFAQYASPRHRALPLISWRTTTSTGGGIKTRCRGLCPSVLPCCHLLRLRPLFAPFHTVFGTFSPHLFTVRERERENRNLNASPGSSDQWSSGRVLGGAFNCSSVQIVV